MKTEFVQAVAHEFRTPLNSIQGLTEHLLNREDLSDEQRRKFLDNIHERSVALGRAVLNILNITRISKGQELPLIKESYRVKEIFDQLDPFLEISASGHRMEITFTEEDARLRVDKAKTEQVLENIVSNALKYSDVGSLVQIRGEPEGEFYRISVTDQGIGMTPEQVARVFDKFYRVDAFPTAIASVGIGMSIVKHIVEAHGGEIRVDSEPHHGTQVSFTMPRDATAKHEAG